MRISVVGLGRLGAPMATCFAAKGFNVIAVDIDPKKVEDLNAGIAPVSETGLQELLKQPGLCLLATTNLDQAILNSDVTFVVTATPSESNGKFSLKYVLPVCEKIGSVLARKDKFHVVVITSTVMPGDCDGPIKEVLEKTSGGVCGEQFGLVYNPEFIALGSVIKDFLHPDFVLLGANDPLSYARIAQIYESCIDSPVIKSMSRINAELTKLALNNFLCMKISYGNMLARICESISGTDVDVISDAIGTDSRIGNKYLKGGVSYGGPCLVRDTKAMASLGQSLPLAIDTFNEAQVFHIADLVESFVEGPRVPVAEVWGRSYKLGTSVQEESFGYKLHAELEKRGLAEVYHNTNWEPEVVVLALPDPRYAECNFSGKIVIDCWRAFKHLAEDSSIRYVPLGIGK